eukprot:SM000030S11378  [mRNA]  locus=s30:442851:444329:+ [translate_table: standard]
MGARNPAATLFLGNLHERVDERLLLELMAQAGPVADVHIPRDRETRRHRGYAFAEYETEEIARYALELFSAQPIYLYHRLVRFMASPSLPKTAGRLSFTLPSFVLSCPSLPYPAQLPVAFLPHKALAPALRLLAGQALTCIFERRPSTSKLARCEACSTKSPIRAPGGLVPLLAVAGWKCPKEDSQPRNEPVGRAYPHEQRSRKPTPPSLSRPMRMSGADKQRRQIPASPYDMGQLDGGFLDPTRQQACLPLPLQFLPAYGAPSPNTTAPIFFAGRGYNGTTGQLGQSHPDNPSAGADSGPLLPSPLQTT